MKPPFVVTSAIIQSLTGISFLLGAVETKGAHVPNPQLRKKNKIRTIRATLAIEGSTISEKQITDLLDGKRVVGAPNEILEVKNAISLYDQIGSFKSSDVDDFLQAHRILMSSLIPDAGEFRCKNVGVLKGERLVHAAPQAKLVAELIGKHFDWLENDLETHAILKSCVAHYEIEFIHPFMDGNGRMGRFWQTLILSEFNPVFKYLPIESIVNRRQEEYYKKLEESDKEGASTDFITFMLEVLIEALTDFNESFSGRVNTIEFRLELAKEKFKVKSFSRKEYQQLISGISTATASRDLKFWVDHGVLEKFGKHNQTKYSFKKD